MNTTRDPLIARFMRLRFVTLMLALLLPAVLLPADVSAAPPINVVVMDPMALPLSCACVKGKGQRRYESLVQHAGRILGVEINLLYEESLQLALRRDVPSIDVVIGKRSTVLADAQATKQSLKAVAGLADDSGATSMTGVVLVAKEAGFSSLTDLAGLKVAIGSEEHDECHRQAKMMFEKQRVEVTWVDPGSIESAVYAFSDGEADAVVVSDYLPELLEGCGKIEQGTTRALANTDSVPGVQLFVSESLNADVSEKLIAALVDASGLPAIRRSLESRDGFVLVADREGLADQHSSPAAIWSDWRGPGRSGQSASIPRSLGDELKVLWRSELTGPAMAGLTATNDYVLVADKSSDMKTDLFHAIRVDSGETAWTVRHEAAGRMEYTNAPRATPVVAGDRVLLQSAFGKLWCVELESGRELWTKHMVDDFGGKVPTWGYSVPPLVVDDRVIIAPGSAGASVVALSLETGEVLWKTAGHAPAYAPFLFGTFGGREQVVGYDSAGLGGWDHRRGQRLWELIPPDASDFHVGTPVAFRGGILVATENNATRRYRFDESGRIVAQPVAENLDCAPDTCTPVVVDSPAGARLFCTAYGEMYCVDGDGLQTIWNEIDDRFYDHTCLIAGNGRVMLWGSECDLLLFDASADTMELVSEFRPMSGDHPESMSHPAIVGDRLYLRSQYELVCIQMPVSTPDRGEEVR